MTNEEKIVPIAIPGIHSRFLEFWKQEVGSRKLKVLDVGAGHGAFTKKLYEMGHEVSACDLFPENFYFDKVECRKADLTKSLPYDNNCFEAVIAMEVTEHIVDHIQFFKEISRVLKPGGKLYISTPNILSLKSRLRFMLSGFYYSFKPLELTNYNGLQHVASLTTDQYNYIAIAEGFRPAVINIDKHQGTSSVLMIFYPLLWLFVKLKKIEPIHNTSKLLLGRILFLSFEKRA